MLRHPRWLLLLALSACVATPVPGPSSDDPNFGFTEGEPSDEREDAPFDWGAKFDRPAPYTVPDDLPELVDPEIIVSLEGLTVHLFDRETGFSRVYPTGVGTLGRSGQSVTPTGHFATGADTGNGWWYVPTRWDPAYFEGYPFLRLTTRNSNGYNTYGLHGPITNPLQRGYVSHGCMRMAKHDIVELFFLVKDQPSTPVTIQQEVEVDAVGEPVDVGFEAALYAPGDAIAYGASVGPRGTESFIGDACDDHADCGGYAGATDVFCHPAGFCTQKCQGYCPDQPGRAATFCAVDPTWPRRGICASKPGPENHDCATVPGTVPEMASRFIGASAAPDATSPICAPSS